MQPFENENPDVTFRFGEKNEEAQAPVPQNEVQSEPEVVSQQEEPAPRQEEPAPRQEEPAPQQPVYGAYQNVGAGRKESPFAGSPFQSPYDSGRSATGRTDPYQNAGFTPGYQVPPVKKTRQKKQRRGGRKVLSALLILILVAGSCFATARIVDDRWQERSDAMIDSFDQRINALQEQVTAAEDAAKAAQDAAAQANAGNSVSGSLVATSNGLTPSQVYAKNVNSVVAISNQATTNYYGQVSQTASSGTGFILSEDGYVITNYHVVEGATTLTVITYDTTEYDAKLIGYDEMNDVALLKVDAAGLQPVTLGSSDDLIVGDQVVAIGNPLGELTSTLTVGYISAKDRTISTDSSNINMMQTDAAINSGNSGGPLFNMKGEVVGITTAKYSGTSGSGATIEGIGFAIPIDDVASMLNDLKNYGYITGAYLGVTVRSLDEDTAKVYSLPVGSLVDTVTEGTCAYEAGVQSGDIIIGLGEYKVTNNSDLTRALRKFAPGDTTVIKVYRAGAELEFSITLDEKPRDLTQPQQTQPSTQPTDPEQIPGAGEGEVPSEGSYEDWFKYFFPYFGND